MLTKEDTGFESHGTPFRSSYFILFFQHPHPHSDRCCTSKFNRFILKLHLYPRSWAHHLHSNLTLPVGFCKLPQDFLTEKNLLCTWQVTRNINALDTNVGTSKCLPLAIRSKVSPGAAVVVAAPSTTSICRTSCFLTSFQLLNSSQNCILSSLRRLFWLSAVSSPKRRFSSLNSICYPSQTLLCVSKIFILSDPHPFGDT